MSTPIETALLKIPAREIQAGDRLVWFGWTVTEVKPGLTSDKQAYVSVQGIDAKGHLSGTALQPDVEITVERPEPVEPPVSRAALVALMAQWTAAANALDTEAINRTLAEPWTSRHVFRLQGEVAQIRACVMELGALLDLTAATAAVPVTEQCGEGPHGQPCGQPVIDGVCPDHGEVGP
jgi:hypothetical protein